MVTVHKGGGGDRARRGPTPLSSESGMSSVPESESSAGRSGCVGREVRSFVAWGWPGSASRRARPTASRRHHQGGRTGLSPVGETWEGGGVGGKNRARSQLEQEIILFRSDCSRGTQAPVQNGAQCRMRQGQRGF